MMQGMERRLEPRHSLRLGVEVRFAEGGADGMLRCHSGNVCLGGIYLDARALPLEEDLQVELVLAAGAACTTRPRLPARVVRNDGQGCALVFALPDAQNAQALARLLQQAKGAAQD